MHSIKSVCIYKFAQQTTLAFLIRREDTRWKGWAYFYDDKIKGNEREMTCGKSSLSGPIVNKELCSWD